MDRENIIKQVKHICGEVTGVDEQDIGLYANFREELGFPTMELAEIFSRVQHTFSITFSPAMIRSIKTLGQLVDLVEEEL